MMKMIYLASPYSHPVKAVKEERFRRVCKFAAELIETGEYIVFCPIAHSHPIAEIGGCSGGWETWKQQDLPFVTLADELHVLCLPGWLESEGVEAELRHFRLNHPGYPVIHHYVDEPCELL